MATSWCSPSGSALSFSNNKGKPRPPGGPPTLRCVDGDGSSRRNRRKPQQIGLCVRRQANVRIDEHPWRYVVVRKGEGPLIRVCGSGSEIRLLLVVYRLGGVWSSVMTSVGHHRHRCWLNVAQNVNWCPDWWRRFRLLALARQDLRYRVARVVYVSVKLLAFFWSTANVRPFVYVAEWGSAYYTCLLHLSVCLSDSSYLPRQYTWK